MLHTSNTTATVRVVDDDWLAFGEGIAQACSTKDFMSTFSHLSLAGTLVAECHLIALIVAMFASVCNALLFWLLSLKLAMLLLLLNCIRASIDDVDEAEIKQRERAHAASQAKHGELKQEYEAMLETQRQLRKVEAEENERKLRKFLASDPEFCASNPSQSSSPSEMYLADQEADVVERLRREEEELRKRLEQEQKDAEFARKLADQLEGTSKRSHSSEEASTATGFASSSRKRSLHNTSNTSVSPRRTSAKHLRSPADKQGNLCGLNRAVREPLSGRRFLSSTQTMDNVSSPAPRKRMAREPSSPAIVDLVDLSSPTAEAVGGISTRPTSATGSKHPTQLSSLTLVRTLARNHRPADCFNKAVPGNTLHRFLRLSQSPPNPRTS